jgi:molybdopterin molybdotransferase
MISLDDAFARIDDVISRVSPADEWIPVKEALDRLLVKDQFSKFDLPPFDRALRDGYVVAEGDERESYRVVGEIMAGAATRKRLAPGTAIKVATGAPLPKGAGRVIMRDHAEEKDGAVRVVGKSTRSYVSLKGSDVRKGDRILTPGEIGAVEIGNLISCGVTEIQVRRKLRIAIISTGDELVDTAAELKPGKVINTNAPMIAAMAQEYDLRVVFEKTVPDDPAATLRAIKSARAKADLVILTGGVSVGDKDYVRAALEKAGFEIHFSSVAIKPGEPTVFASNEARFAFGLPGNPVSAYVTFHLFVVRAINWLNGFQPDSKEVVEHDYYKLKLFRDYDRDEADRLEYVPARVSAWPVNTEGDCEMEVEPVEYHGSAHLAALSEAIGFFVVPAGTKHIAAGEEVVFTTF